MAKSYNLTMQLNLQGPANLKSVSSKIRKELASASGSLNITIDKSSLSSIDTATKKLRTMASALKASNQSALVLNANLSKLGRSLTTVAASANSATTSYNKVGQSSAKMAKSLEKASSSAKTLGEALASRAYDVAIYSTITRLTNTMTTAFLNAADAAVEFERDMNRLQQITGASADTIAAVEKRIRSLSTEFGVNSTELAKVAVTFQQAGLDSAQLAASLKAVAQASLTPTFSSMKDATEGAIAALRQFNLEAAQIQGAFDAMNSVAGQFAVEFDDLVSAIQRGGGAFAAAAGDMQDGSKSLNEFLALFTTVRSTTRESSETIATGIRTISARLQQLSTQRSIQDILGDDLQLTVNGEFVGVYKAIDNISAKVRELGLSTQDARFAKLAEEIGGIRQISRVIPLLTETETRIKALATAEGAAGSSADAAALAQKSLAVQLAQTAEALKSTFVAFFNAPGMKESISFFLTITKLAAGFAKAFAPLAPIFTIMAGFKGIKGLASPAKGGGGLFGRLFGGKKAQTQQRALVMATHKQTQQSVVQTQASINQFSATKENTAALQNLTSAISGLVGKSPEVTGFARGGVVPGTGRGDTVPAMLTPGEFVIRKDAVKAIGTEKLHKMNKYAGGGIVEKESVGGIALYDPVVDRSTTVSGSISKEQVLSQFKGDKSKQGLIEEAIETRAGGWGLHGATASARMYGIFNESINEGLAEGVNATNRILGAKIGGDIGSRISSSVIDNGSINNFLSSINNAEKGNLFEKVLTSINRTGKFTDTENPQAPFDFTNGLNADLVTLFPGIVQKYVDAKSNIDRIEPIEFAKKIGNQILEEKGISTVADQKDTTYDRLLKLTKGAKGPFSLQSLRSGLAEGGSKSESALKKALSATALERLEKANKIRVSQQGAGKPKEVEFLAKGGSVSDTVPAMLTPGEFVINKRAAAKIGASTLNKMNHADKAKAFNKGGPVGFVQNFADGGEALYSSLNMSQVAKEIGLLEKEMKGMNKTSEEYKAALELQTELLKKAQQLKEEKFAGKVSAGKGGGFAAVTGAVPNPVQDAKNLAASMAYIQDQADRSGVALDAFTKSLQDRAKEVYSSKKDSIGENRKNLRSGILGGLANKDKLKGDKQSQDNFKGQLANQLTSILADVDADRLTNVLEETLRQVEAGKSLAEITESIPELKDAFDETKDSARAAAASTKSLTDEFGAGAASLKLSSQQIAEIEWDKAGGRNKLGGLGKLLDAGKNAGLTKGGAYEFSQSKFGQKLTSLQDKLSKPADFAMGQLGKIPKVGPGLAKGLGGLAKGLGGLKSALGGIPGIASAAASAIAGQFLPTLEQTTSASEAAMVEGTRGALSGAATGAAIGSFIPVIGTAVGAIVGGIVGGITGAIKGFRAKTLELSLKKLGDATKTLGDKFDNYERVKTSESLAEVRKAASAQTSSLGDVRSQAAMGSQRTYANYIGSSLTLGLMRFGRPDELNDQAQESYLNSLDEFHSGIERLGKINAEGLTLSTIQQREDSIKQGNLGNSTLVQTAMKDFGLSQRDLARQLAENKLKQTFGTGDLFRKEFAKAQSSGELDRVGNELLKEKALVFEQEQRQKKIQEQINNEIENTLSKYKTMNDIVDRMRQEMENTVQEVQQMSYNANGNREVSAGFLQNRNKQLQILNNPRAYSQDQFNDVADQTGTLLKGLGFDDVGKEVADAFKAGRAIDVDLPRILAQADATNVDVVADRLDDVLKNAGVSDTSRQGINKDVIDAIRRKTEGGGTVTLQSLADEVPALAAALKNVQAQQELGKNIQQLWNDALTQSINIANQWTEALEESRKRTLQAEKARINAANAIKEARGGTLSLSERNAGFKAEINSLLPPELRVKGSTINEAEVQAIADRRAAGQQDIKDLQNKIDTAAPGTDTAPLIKQLAELQRADANLVTALDTVANSTEAMDNALRAYAEQQQRDNKRLGAGENLLTAQPDELFEMNRDINAMNTALSGSLAERQAQYATAEGRAQVLRGVERAANSLGWDEEQTNRVKAQVTLDMYEVNEDFKKFLDIQGQDGRTYREVLENQMKPQENPLLKAAEAAAAAQAKAADSLAYIQNNLANDIGAKISEPFKTFREQLAQELTRAQEERAQQDVTGRGAGAGGAGGGYTGPGGRAGDTEFQKLATGRGNLQAESAATASSISAIFDKAAKTNSMKKKMINDAGGGIDPEAYARATAEERQAMLDAYKFLGPSELEKLKQLLTLYSNQSKAVDAVTQQMERLSEQAYEEASGIPVGIVHPDYIPPEQGGVPNTDLYGQTFGGLDSHLTQNGLEGWTDANPLPVRVVDFGKLPEEAGPTLGEVHATNPPVLGPGVSLTGAARRGMEQTPQPATSDENKSGLFTTKFLDALNAVLNISRGMDAMKSTIDSIFEQTKKLDGLSELIKTIKIPLEITDKSKETINTFTFAVNNFDQSINRYIDRLEKIHIPDEVIVKANHTVNVNHNGAEVFAVLESSLSKMVVNKIKEAFDDRFDGQAGK